jgi:hypothetical protein
MKLETITYQTKAVFLEGKDSCVDVIPWGSLEGCTVMVTSRKDQSVRLAASLRWEELDILICAITAARAE